MARIDNEGRIHRTRRPPLAQPPMQQPQSQPEGFPRRFIVFFDGLKTFFLGVLAILPQMIAVLTYILGLFFVDSHASVKVLMLIPCAIVFFTGWKGLIGVVLLVGLVQTC